ncbi:16S rRNA (adenine(1518)-N(6)/adenine(1519)-N(6))-dimethyltransferase RsmA [Thiobacter sp. AK1]|uniref:Ribosomal RNA small subunit methyltransferase A n=2 Tax=Thiobacter aerophilum TaxID=3121275 RepID=A0ABV0EIN9_9BURK
MQHTPRKRFGQNFLHDPHFVRRCLEAIAPRPEDTLVEIGPGLGALTAPLLEKVHHLHVVEIDRDLAADLRRRFPAERLTVHEGDALRFDFASLGPDLRVVGNLPYNISTPLLFHLAAFGDTLRDLHVMLQKEVVARMAATPSSPAYGRLSVMLQYRFAVKPLFDVPGGAFRPPPKVTSSFVRLAPLRPLPHPARNERIFATMVASAFSTRRKTLRNALRSHLEAADFAALSIPPTLRAENLSVADFVRLADYVASRHGYT